MVRAAISAKINRLAPAKVVNGSKKRWSGPQTRRTACGTIIPTKPIVPTKETAAAVISVAAASRPWRLIHANAKDAKIVVARGKVRAQKMLSPAKELENLESRR